MNVLWVYVEFHRHDGAHFEIMRQTTNYQFSWLLGRRRPRPSMSYLITQITFTPPSAPAIPLYVERPKDCKLVVLLSSRNVCSSFTDLVSNRDDKKERVFKSSRDKPSKDERPRKHPTESLCRSPPRVGEGKVQRRRVVKQMFFKASRWQQETAVWLITCRTDRILIPEYVKWPRVANCWQLFQCDHSHEKYRKQLRAVSCNQARICETVLGVVRGQNDIGKLNRLIFNWTNSNQVFSSNDVSSLKRTDLKWVCSRLLLCLLTWARSLLVKKNLWLVTLDCSILKATFADVWETS